MPDQTPVTDDDLKAHKWASHYGGGPMDPVARAIRAHVPAPPATLADELRKLATDVVTLDIGAQFFIADKDKAHHAIIDLADRVEAVEKELDGRKRDYIECQEELLASERELTEVRRERNEYRFEVKRLDDELDDSRAEVEWRAELLGKKDIRIRDQRRELARLNAEVERLTRDPTVKDSFTVALPDPADVPQDEPYLVTYHGAKWIGLRNDPGDEAEPWHLTHLTATFDEWDSDDAVTLVARLVPEPGAKMGGDVLE